MDPLHEPGTAPGTAEAKANPLEVQLNVTDEAAERLREALAKDDAVNQWVRIYPQGIS